MYRGGSRTASMTGDHHGLRPQFGCPLFSEHHPVPHSPYQLGFSSSVTDIQNDDVGDEKGFCDKCLLRPILRSQ